MNFIIDFLRLVSHVCIKKVRRCSNTDVSDNLQKWEDKKNLKKLRSWKHPALWVIGPHLLSHTYRAWSGSIFTESSCEVRALWNRITNKPNVTGSPLQHTCTESRGDWRQSWVLLTYEPLHLFCLFNHWTSPPHFFLKVEGLPSFSRLPPERDETRGGGGRTQR